MTDLATKAAERVVDALRGVPQGLTAERLAMMARIGRKAAEARLRRAVDDGAVFSEGGVYQEVTDTRIVDGGGAR